MRKYSAFLFLLAAVPATAQDLEATWTQTFNNSAFSLDDDGIDVAVDGSDNVYVLGSTVTTNQGKKFLVLKYDSNGTFQWSRQVNGTANLNDVPKAMAVDSAGNVFVTGTSNNGANNEYLTAKFDSAGNMAYSTPFNLAAGADEVHDICTDGAGNAYVVGESFNGSSRDYAIVRYNANGTEAWRRNENGPGNGTDRCRGIIFDNGFLYITGELFVSGSDKDFGTGKYNPANGSKVWLSRFINNHDDQASAYDLDMGMNGNLACVGQWKRNNGDFSMSIAWFNSTTGNVVAPDFSQPDLGTINFSNQNTVAKAVSAGKFFGFANGGAFVAGYGQINASFQVMSNVTLFGANQYMGSGSARAWDPTVIPGVDSGDVITDNRGCGYAVFTGVTNSEQGYDMLVFRDMGGSTTADGQFFFDSGNGNDAGTAITLDSQHNLITVGSRRNSNATTDVVVIKIKQSVGCLSESYHGFKNQQLSVNAADGVFSNDIAPFGAIAVLQQNVEQGTLSLANDGSFTYDPPVNFTGSATFTYIGNKGGLMSDTFGTVSINIHPNITSLALPAECVGGVQNFGAVNFDGNVPFEGIFLTTALDVPGAIKFPNGVYAGGGGGGTNAQFVFDPQGVSADTTVTVTVSQPGSQASDSIVIKPGGITNAFANPSTVVGGDSATGTVNLATPAGIGGQEVTLSSNSGSVVVPASFTIADGTASGSFNISTLAVQATFTRQITATAGVSSKVFNITLKPAPKLSTLALSPTSVHGGQNTTGTVTLTSTGAVGGTQVSLTDNSGSITTPPSVVVPNSSSSATFTAGTLQVASTATRTITATLDAISKTANLTIVPSPTLSNLVISPSVVSGGQSTTGTVTLSGNASSGNIVVAVSDNSGSISTPPSATVTQGTSSKNFAINTSAVLSSNTRQVTATLLGVTKTANLSLHPAPKLTALSINPNTVKGGNSTTGTITYDFPAGVGGNSSSITDNSASITTPSSVTVLNGNTTANFNIATSAVASSATRTVTATRNGISRTANLTLTP